jgi:N-acetylglucosaminyldiphosphoundecaprenol N-acetyl-beta-D-mannosaminyltransferase
MRLQKNHTSKVNILGIGISPIKMDDALEVVAQWVHEQAHSYVCVTSVNGIMESQQSPDLRAIHNDAGMVTPDGMPLVWLSHLTGHKNVERVYGPDLMLAVCEASLKEGYRHFLYGGEEGIPELLAQQLQKRFPGLCITGTYSPPFRPLTPEEDAAIIQTINKSGADIVWVGLSTPKQELWMADHVGKLNAAVLIGVGAAFDFHAGVKKQAPHWVQRHGFEWLFRLLSEPRRLWRRYLIYNPLFLGLVFLQLIGWKKYTLPEGDKPEKVAARLQQADGFSD